MSVTRFCKTHVVDRSKEELEQRRDELQVRDLSSKPGLRAELERIETELRVRLTLGNINGRI